MSTQARQPAGVPTGGQFAATARAESGITLTPDRAAAQAAATTHRRPAAGIPMLPTQPAGPDLITGVPAHLKPGGAS